MALTQEEIAGARLKPYHEQSLEEKNAIAFDDVKKASPTPEEVQAQARAQNKANELAHQAVENWLRMEEAGQDRYEASMENMGRLHAILGKLHGGMYSEENLAAALEYGLNNNIIQAKPAAPKDDTPKTLREWAAHLGYTTEKIRSRGTSAERFRELYKDPFHKQVIDYVLANRI